MPERPLNLIKATISLFEAAADGSGTGSALFMGVCVESMKLIYRFEQKETRPTGRQYPRRRTINEEHEIQFDRTWAIDGADYEMDRDKRYVLEVEWADEVGTHKRTYYGVTQDTHDLNTLGQARMDNIQTLRAEYFTEENS